MAGYELTPVTTDARGNIDLDDLRGKVDEHTAGLMLTNPSTLGLFDENIEAIRDIFHAAGALMYYDGANLNAVCGMSRPATWGSTSSTSTCTRRSRSRTAAAARAAARSRCATSLAPYLPVPVVVARRRPLPARPRPAEVDRQGARLHRAVRRLRALVRVHARVGAGAARDERGRRAERELYARPAARRLRAAVRPALHARVRAQRRSLKRSTASRRSTSPSG